MADIWSRKKRSEVMSAIRAKKNESTELRLMRLFRSNAVRGWRRNRPLMGKPDFVFPATGLCVFVDGCFWHVCPKCYSSPKSNRTFWREKATRNRTRDRLVTRELRREGWKVIRVWEHDLTDSRAHLVLRRIRKGVDSSG